MTVRFSTVSEPLVEMPSLTSLTIAPPSGFWFRLQMFIVPSDSVTTEFRAKSRQESFALEIVKSLIVTTVPSPLP